MNLGGMDKPVHSALAQLLLKAVSNDKRFVLEAARQVLGTCARCLDAKVMQEQLLPFTKHKCAPPHFSALHSSRWLAWHLHAFMCTGCFADHSPAMYTSHSGRRKVGILTLHMPTCWPVQLCIGSNLSRVQLTCSPGCRNPKVRGAVADTVLDVLRQAQHSQPGCAATDICEPESLLPAMTPLLADNTPEARASSRRVVSLLKVCPAIKHIVWMSVQSPVTPRFIRACGRFAVACAAAWRYCACDQVYSEDT